MSLSLERLRELLHYDPVTGIFTRIKARKSAPRWEGKRAGWKTKNGYRMTYVDGSYYLEHRLAWFYMTGAWPKCLIDHADMNPLNNTFLNLRESTKSTNGANRGKQANNSSGFKGVVKHRHKWRVQIHVNGKNKYIGLFNTREEASKAYEERAKLEYGEFAKAR